MGNKEQEKLLVAEAFNYMYSGIFNGKTAPNLSSDEFKKAFECVGNYEQLAEAVMKELAEIKFQYETRRQIEFKASEKAFLDLDCNYFYDGIGKQTKTSYAEDGTVVNKETNRIKNRVESVQFGE